MSRRASPTLRETREYLQKHPTHPPVQPPVVEKKRLEGFCRPLFRGLPLVEADGGVVWEATRAGSQGRERDRRVTCSFVTSRGIVLVT